MTTSSRSNQVRRKRDDKSRCTLHRFVALRDESIELTNANQYTLGKDLEKLLEVEWGAEGKGLHEKLNSVQASSQPLPEVSRRPACLCAVCAYS